MIAALALTLAGAPAATTPEAWPPPKASVLVQQPPVIVTDSPPPIVAVPHVPGTPVLIPYPLAPPAPPPPRAAIVRAPQPRTPLQQLISANDYPASALRQGHQGSVRFILDVGPVGRVHGCAGTRSSGASPLDSTTCAIMRRRARFTPAIDSNGMPAAGRVTDEAEWGLPEPAGAERG